MPIAEQLFANEPEAWQAAYGHWMDKCKTGIGGIVLDKVLLGGRKVDMDKTRSYVFT